MSLYRYECDICEESTPTNQMFVCLECKRAIGFLCHAQTSRKREKEDLPGVFVDLEYTGTCKECHFKKMNK
jgi:Fe2+ or Zn2+ uptake regulation protein